MSGWVKSLEMGDPEGMEARSKMRERGLAKGSCCERAVLVPRLVVGLLLTIAAAWLGSCDSLISEKNRILPFQPAVVPLAEVAGPMRVLVLGDFGTGSIGQTEVASAIGELHRARPLDFGVTVGDNFYEHGVSSVSDSKWRRYWEEPYGKLGFPIYPTLGNHDYYGDVQSQLDYVSPSGTWRFPARQYVLRSGLVDLIAIDTMDPREEQYRWLDQQLSTSQALWKIVYGHHPIYSAGHHGDTLAVERVLWPLLRGRVAMYLAGHDHDLQHLRPIDGTHLVISGGGGAKLRPLRPDPRTIFARTMYGFTTLEISRERIRMEMFDQKGRRVHEAEICETPVRAGQPMPHPRAPSHGDAPR